MIKQATNPQQLQPLLGWSSELRPSSIHIFNQQTAPAGKARMEREEGGWKAKEDGKRKTKKQKTERNVVRERSFLGCNSIFPWNETKTVYCLMYRHDFSLLWDKLNLKYFTGYFTNKCLFCVDSIAFPKTSFYRPFDNFLKKFTIHCGTKSYRCSIYFYVKSLKRCMIRIHYFYWWTEVLLKYVG